MIMMWAEHCQILEPPLLLSAQWHYRFLERGWQIFFGGVFDKRVGMLFPTNLRFARDVHRRDRVSKTVTKNIWVSFFFKNPKTKERPKEAPAETCLTGRQAGERSFP
ncbi:MAG: hypothetical protein JW870_10910, partial [Candidatus Delongbacteria bacterium]|nr:hypothetical protein [Candidatus Delongbacteria bacterium]